MHVGVSDKQSTVLHTLILSSQRRFVLLYLMFVILVVLGEADIFGGSMR